MGAGIIELISNIVNITGNPIADTIIFAIIGSISASIAFGFVEILFDAIGKYDSKTMSDVHWGVRVIIFAFLTFILVKIAQFFRWLFTPPQLYYFIAVVLLSMLVIVIIVIIKFKKNVSKTETLSELVIQRPEVKIEQPTQVTSQKNNKNPDICLFCGGLLVSRKGPYGRFLGCTNFPKCKYTRK